MSKDIALSLGALFFFFVTCVFKIKQRIRIVLHT